MPIFPAIRVPQSAPAAGSDLDCSLNWVDSGGEWEGCLDDCVHAVPGVQNK